MTLTPCGKAKDVLIHFPLLWRHRDTSFILFTPIFDCSFSDPFRGHGTYPRDVSTLVGVGGKERDQSVEGHCFCKIRAAPRVLSRDSTPRPDVDTEHQGRLPGQGKPHGSLRSWTDHED